MRYRKFDPLKIKLHSLIERQNKMTLAELNPVSHQAQISDDPEIKMIAKRIIEARRLGKNVVWMMGSHPLRTGNSRLIIDLMERGYITHLAVNGSVAIHDFELAYQGATLEDVEFYIKDGKFGNWKELNAINNAISKGSYSGVGIGMSIGRLIEKQTWRKMPYREISLFAAAYRLRIPVTVHKSIGQDITDQLPSANFSAIGKAAGIDFLIFAESISELEGGVFLNIGSQVTGPEVYLKALSMARNVASQNGRSINHFTTAVFDIVDLGNWREDKDGVNYRRSEVMASQRYYFRPMKTILIRTTKDGGESFYVKGNFTESIPCLYANIIH